MPHYYLNRCKDVDTVQGSETSKGEKLRKKEEEEKEEEKKCWTGRQLKSDYQTPSA